MFDTRRLRRVCSSILENVFALRHRSINLFSLARAGCTGSSFFTHRATHRMSKYTRSKYTRERSYSDATTCQHHRFIVFPFSLFSYRHLRFLVQRRKIPRNTRYLPVIKKDATSIAKYRVRFVKLPTDIHVSKWSIYLIEILKNLRFHFSVTSITLLNYLHINASKIIQCKSTNDNALLNHYNISPVI